MLYLSQMLGKPVLDSQGEEVGRISDLAIQTGEVFPRITSLAFLGPSKTPFMVSWRKYVESYEDGRILLNKPGMDVRFSYLQPDEILLARDLLNKQIVDTQGLKVVRVNDLKLSTSGRQLRLLGAEVGIRGILRGLSPALERVALSFTKVFGHGLEENIIAWNYMELVDRDLSNVKLSMTHKRLSELHPADVADILEQLDPKQRGLVFDHLDKQQAAETFSELQDEYQADMIDDLTEHEASELLAQMDPDDAADILGDLPYEKAEKLLWLMGVQDQRRIRSLLGYKEKTAGGIMTPEFVAVGEDATVGETIERLRSLDEDFESVHYVYTLDGQARLTGALSLRSLVLAAGDTKARELATHDLITVAPDDDQEDVADAISKYDLLAMPVVDENGVLLGIVTVDDALDVLEEEHSEDLQIVGAGSLARAGRTGRDSERQGLGDLLVWLLRKELWFVVWAVLAFLVTMSGNLELLAPSLVFMPFVLLIATDVVAFAVNDLIEYGSADDAPAIGRLFGRNVAASILTAGAAALLGLLLFASMGSDVPPADSPMASESSTLYPLQAMLLEGFFPAVVACFAVIALSVLVTVVARRRLDHDRPLSVTSLSLFMMLFGLVVQMGLQVALVYGGTVGPVA
ncbi:MAG: CBS domain-containing protein [Coriobacteriales bacterium]|jgi:Mg2+ transporter MgtE|nr:CBS domain-containing protein [Coriobacteriales bacterium]